MQFCRQRFNEKRSILEARRLPAGAPAAQSRVRHAVLFGELRHDLILQREDAVERTIDLRVGERVTHAGLSPTSGHARLCVCALPRTARLSARTYPRLDRMRSMIP